MGRACCWVRASLFGPLGGVKRALVESKRVLSGPLGGFESGIVGSDRVGGVERGVVRLDEALVGLLGCIERGVVRIRPRLVGSVRWRQLRHLQVQSSIFKWRRAFAPLGPREPRRVRQVVLGMVSRNPCGSRRVR